MALYFEISEELLRIPNQVVHLHVLPLLVQKYLWCLKLPIIIIEYISTYRYILDDYKDGWDNWWIEEKVEI